MNDFIEKVEYTLREYYPRLQQISEQDFDVQTKTGGWTKKEILGHLVDSVQNNIRRFMVAQYETEPHIVYAQDYWVTAANYRQYPSGQLLTLWSALNQHAIIILKNIPPGLEKRTCITEAAHSIEWLAQDYLRHLLHHLHQVLELEPIPYP